VQHVETIPVLLLPKQYEFLTSRADAVLYSGAFGAGKTRALCEKIAARARVPGAWEGLCRKTLVSLKGSTLRTLLRPEGDLPPVLREGSYKHHKGDGIIEINGGGAIDYFGMGDAEDYQKIGSKNLSGCAVDEAVELTEEDWTMLDGRLRLNVGIPNQIYGACNPGPPSHHLAKRFGLALGHKPEEGHVAITTSSAENTFLTARYIKRLNRYTGLRRKRYVLGQWVGSEGLVYDAWDRDKHIRTRPREEFSRVIAGMDVGYKNPSVILVIQIDADDRMHVVREFYEREVVPDQLIAEAVKLYGEWDVSEFVVDPSAAGTIASLRAAGCFVREGQNAVFDGIQAVQNRLPIEGDGIPRLTIDPACDQTIREFETYEWKPIRKGSTTLKDEPVKEEDHAMDALRYAVVSVDGLRSQPRMRVPGRRRRSRVSDDERMWTEVGGYD